MSENSSSNNTFSYTSIDQIGVKVQRQREFFKNGRTIDVNQRIKALKKLLSEINSKEEEITKAMYSDFHKSEFEAFETEIGLVKSEIKLAIGKVKNWISKSFEGYSLLNFPAKLYLEPIPYGNTLIISPWNYPFLLALSPLIGAIAAGNTCILKLSELTENTSMVLEEIISNSFDPGLVDVVQGGVEESQVLLNYSFDFLFFTGSTEVGKIVYKKAADHLCPVVLELGGKSPCIINQDADIEIAAKRIVWGKFLNGGQTCVAPDYLIIHSALKAQLIDKIKYYIKKFYGEDAQKSPDYPRIINKNNFERIGKMLSGANIIYGGKTDIKDLYIEPTLIEIDDISGTLMKEEIFGPLLPILSFDSILELNDVLSKNEKPLALYVFTDDDDFAKQVISENPSGDVCINDVVSHFAEKKFGVGGIGSSGFGKYHGRKSFEAFSHHKSILKRSIWPDLPLRYPPYRNKLGIIKALLNKL